MGTNPSKPDSWERIPVNKLDARFPSLQQGFNRRWVAHNLESVYLVYTPDGTCRALDDAITRHGKTVQIISGGHCYEDFVFNEGVKAVINVTNLVESGRDPVKGYYVSSGDTNWNSFGTLFRNYGLVLPGGSCYSVGLGGHISGGGDGILSRQHGLTVDWLTGVEVVVKPNIGAGAVLKYVSRDSISQSDRDLFWAHTGGGGGSFGVITKFYFKTLPKSPKGIIASNITFSWSDVDAEKLKSLLDWYINLAQTCPRETVGKFPIAHESAGEFVMFLYTSYTNEEEKIKAKEYHWELEMELQNIVRFSLPTRPSAGHAGWLPFPMRKRKCHATKTNFMSDDTLDYPMYTLTQTINGSGPNQRGKYKSAYMTRGFPQEQIDQMFLHLHRIPDGLERSDMMDSLVQVDIFGGKINEVPPAETAIAQRSYIVKLQYQTYWAYPADDSGHLNWIDEFYKGMYGPYGGVPDPDTVVEGSVGLFEGCYYNYPDVDLNKWKDGKYGALYLYFLGNLDRLIRTKQTWDKNDIFHHKQSIPPKQLGSN